MKIINETSLNSFDFWEGGQYFAEKLTVKELHMIEEALEEDYPYGMTEGEVNDLFWFNRDYICNIIGETEESILEREWYE